eukprot:11621050-Karenia_brevis.AAC.1
MASYGHGALILPSRSKRRRDRLKRSAILQSKRQSSLLHEVLKDAINYGEMSTTLNLNAEEFIPPFCSVGSME